MTLRTVVYDRCVGHAGIAALVGTRVYPDRLPEGVTYPAIRYIAPVSEVGATYRTQDGAGGRKESRVQFDSYATTGDGADALADQIRIAWDGYQDDCIVGRAFQVARRMTREDSLNVYRTISDVIVEHSV